MDFIGSLVMTLVLYLFGRLFQIPDVIPAALFFGPLIVSRAGETNVVRATALGGMAAAAAGLALLAAIRWHEAVDLLARVAGHATPDPHTSTVYDTCAASCAALAGALVVALLGAAVGDVLAQPRRARARSVAE